MTLVKITASPTRAGIDAWRVVAQQQHFGPPVSPEAMQKQLDDLLAELRARGFHLGQTDMSAFQPPPQEPEAPRRPWKALIVDDQRYYLEKVDEWLVLNSTLYILRVRTYKDISWWKGEIAHIECLQQSVNACRA